MLSHGYIVADLEARVRELQQELELKKDEEKG